MKKLYIVFVILPLLILAGCSHKYHLSDEIIAEIDKNCKENNSCQLTLNEITDFKWDKCVIFYYGSSNSEISEALGVDYNGITDGHSGIVFAYITKKQSHLTRTIVQNLIFLLISLLEDLLAWRIHMTMRFLKELKRILMVNIIIS